VGKTVQLEYRISLKWYHAAVSFTELSAVQPEQERSEVKPQVVELPPGTLSFDRFRFDRRNQILTEDGEDVTLPPRALAVLDCLLESPGAVVTKEELIDRVWESAIVTETSLTQAISLLRSALGDDSQEPRFIKTVHRRGYRFVAPVTFVHDAPPPLVTESARAIRPIGPVPSPQQLLRRLLLLAVGVVAGLLIIIAMLMRGRPSETTGGAALQPTTRFVIELDQGQYFDTGMRSIAISRDGRTLVYCVTDAAGWGLYRRSLDAMTGVPIKGAEGGWAPFFSPDGEWIAFYTESELRKVPVTGGAAITLCQVDASGSGSWGDDDVIIFTGISPWGLWQIDAAGGEPQCLTAPDTAAGEVSHRTPQLLPDGRSVLFTITSNTPRTALLSLDTLEHSVIAEGMWNARYLPTGHFIFCSFGSLRVQPFDLEQRRPLGDPIEVVSGQEIGSTQLAYSDNGCLFYIPSSRASVDRRLALLTPGAEPEIVPVAARQFQAIKAGPGDEQLAAVIYNGVLNDIWTVRTADGTLSRLTFMGNNAAPIWSPDGTWLAYASSRGGPYDIYRKRVDGSQPAEKLLSGEPHQFPTSWSPDGVELIYTEIHPETGRDIWALGWSEEGWTSRPLIRTEGEEHAGRLSPDGRWLAYSGNPGRQFEVFLQPYPELEGKWQVSTEGGSSPFWAADGGSLYYHHGTEIIRVAVSLDSGVQVGTPVVVVTDTDQVVTARASTVDPGKIVAVVKDKGVVPATEIHGVINWFAELQRPPD
jgi:DNA-binding winged helix-turn-helix (wHTH) protein/Tol biopolymer transport system component